MGLEPYWATVGPLVFYVHNALLCLPCSVKPSKSLLKNDFFQFYIKFAENILRLYCRGYF